jgi:hypothetical protein
MNGHDHSMSLGFDVNKTQGFNTAYITSGAGEQQGLVIGLSQ